MSPPSEPTNPKLFFNNGLEQGQNDDISSSAVTSKKELKSNSVYLFKTPFIVCALPLDVAPSAFLILDSKSENFYLDADGRTWLKEGPNSNTVRSGPMADHV